jgi:hypothetical protein
MTRTNVPAIRHRASSRRCGVQGHLQLWRFCSRRQLRAKKGQSHSGSLAAPEWTGQVLASRLTPAMICIPPSTSQRLHLARREARQFQGNRPKFGKLPRRRRAFVRVLVLCVFGGRQGSLEGVEFRSRSQFFNTKTSTSTNHRISRKMQPSHRDKKHPPGKPQPFPQTRLTSPCRTLGSRGCDRTLRFVLNITGGYWTDHSHEHAQSAKAQAPFRVLGDFGRRAARSELSWTPACSRPTTGKSARHVRFVAGEGIWDRCSR